MLISQNSGRHEHGYLLTVGGGLEGGPDSHLGLTEAHITTDKTIHRLCLFHISLHILGCLQLIRGVFVEEACFQFMLQIGVVAEGKALLTTTFRIKLDQVAGDILDMFLGTLLQAFPLSCAECGETRCLAIVLRLVFRHLIQRVD